MMKKDSDYSLMGSIGFSMLIVALALTPFNGSIALFIKRFLLICGFLLGITSSQISCAQEFKECGSDRGRPNQ